MTNITTRGRVAHLREVARQWRYAARLGKVEGKQRVEKRAEARRRKSQLEEDIKEAETRGEQASVFERAEDRNFQRG